MAFRRFAFEGTTNETLEYMPLDVRRKLDLGGRKLGLAAWQALSLADRRALCDADEPDFAGLVDRLAPLTPSIPPSSPWRDADAALAVPRRAGFPAERWEGLDDAARYALWKVTDPTKLAAAVAELVA